MTANVSIILKEARHVLTISSAALGSTGRNGESRVRVVDAKGRVTPRSVRIGLNDGTRAEVLSGLTPGEKVVVGESAASSSTKPTEAAPAARPRGMPRTVGGL